MITNNGERKPNSGASKAAQANKRAQEQGKRRTEAERKKQANASIATKATSAPKVSQSASTGGTLTTVKQNPSSSSRSSSSSSSSRSSGTSKKALSAAEKSAALNDLMDRATIGSSRTYGLSFQSSVNQKIGSYNQRKQSLVEQATKNGYIARDQQKGYARTAAETARKQSQNIARDQQKGYNRTVSEMQRSTAPSRDQTKGYGKTLTELYRQQAPSKDQQQGYNRTVGEYNRYKTLHSAAAREEAKALDQQRGRNRTVSELDRQISALGKQIDERDTALAAGEKVSGRSKEDLSKERNKLLELKKSVTGNYGILGALRRSIEAGAGAFNSGVTSTLNAGRNVLMQLEAIANGGWDRETGQFVKGDSPITGSLFQPVSDLNQYTKDTTAVLQQSAAQRWANYGKGGDVANQLIQGTISAVPNAVLAMATAGGSAATTLSPEASGLTATVASAVQKLSKDPMYWTSFIQSFGNSYDEAIEKGATEDEALLATLLSSTANAIVEVGGGVEQLPGELRKEGLTSAEKIRKWVSSSLDEGKEEVVQGMIERLVNKAVYNQDAPWLSMSDEEAVVNPLESAKEGAMGAAIGGILGGGQMLAQDAINARNRIVDPTASPLDQAILDALQGVQTPENVTQVREPTELDNIIMETQMQLQSGISPDVATNKPKDVKNLLNATKEQISRFIQNAFNKQNQYQYLKLSDVSPELAATLKNAGIDVDGYAHALRDNDIRHVDSSHGAQSNDKYKVTADMLGDVQNVIDNYDVLYRGFDTRFGNPTVVYEKRMGNRTFYVEEVMSDGVLGTKQMVVTGENSKPSFLKKYTEIASVSDDTDVPAQSGSTGISPPGNHVPDAPYNTSYASNVAQSVDSVNRENVGADASTGAAPAGFDPLSHASNQYGAIPPGENPSRVVDIPVSMDGETKVSKFARTAAEAQTTTDEMVGRIEQLVQDGKLSHEVYSNKQAIEDGAKQIEKQYARGKSIEQIRSEFIRDANAGKAGAKFVSQGTTLYADAIAEGNYNAASDILVALTAVETNAGQAVQAARLMKSLTPEGRIFTVQKMVSNLEAQINQRRSANKQIEIDVPDALLEAYQNAATTDAQEVALQNIYQNVADQIPTSLGEAAQQWRYFSMLANPSTHAKNIMGNVSGTVAKIGKDNLAALMESAIIGDRNKRIARQKQTAQANVVRKYGVDTNLAGDVASIVNGWELPGELVDISKTLAHSDIAIRAISELAGQDLSGSKRDVAHKIREIYRNAQARWDARQARFTRTKAFLNPAKAADQNLLNLGWADYDTAVDLYEDGTGKYSNAAGDINDKRRYWKINDPQNALTRGIDKALNIAEKANNLNSKALEVEDMWFSKPMYSVALAGYMKANGLTEITDAARTYAMTEAKRGTYNDLNAVSKWATSLGKGSKLGRFISGTIYPFKKVPANVMVRTVEYSPLGYLKGAWDLIQMQKGNKDITAAKAIDDFAAATTGTALLGVGAMLAKQGILRATGVGDDKEKEQQKNAFGAKDFSILVGNTYIPIDSLTLTGTAILTGAQIWEAAQNARNGDEPISFDDFLDALSKITDPVFEQSMLSGMDSILTTIQNSGSAGTGELLTKMGVQILGNYVGQYVPTVIGRVAASLDKNQRSTYLEPDGAWGPVQTAVQGVQKKLPGLREDMAVTYGNWGVPVEGNGANGFGEGVFKAVTPVYPSKQKTDAVEEEIARLHDVNAEYSNFYTKPPKSIAVDGENIKLTSEQYANYTETRGQTDYNLRKSMLDSDIYKELPDNVKSKAMSLSQEYANALGKEAAGVGYEIDEKWMNDLKGKPDEEVLKAILGKAIDASGGLGEVDAKTVYTGTQYAGLSGAVMDKSLEYAREYESALAKEKLGYPIESGWIAEAKGLSKEDRTDLFIQKAADSVSNTMGGSKLDNLGTMLEEGTINDAAVYAALSADDLDRYMEVGKGKLGTDKLLDAMSYYNSDECKSVKDASGEVIDGKRQVDNYVNFLQKTGWTDQEKAAAYLQEYTNLKDMPEQWLSAVDDDMIMGAIGKDDLAKWESLGKDTVSAEKVLQATYKFDTLESDKDANGKSISGSKQRKYIDYLDSTDMSEGEKRTLFLMRYTEKNCPYGTGEGHSASIAAPSATTVSSGTTVSTTGNGTSGSGGYSSGGYSGGWSSGKTDEPSQMEKAYTRFGKDAGATETMYQQAKQAHDGMQTIMDMDGNTVRSVEDQFDGWLSQQDWTQEQKDAVRAGFFTDTVKNLQYLSTQLRAGTMSVAAAKNELSPTIQTGWSQNVLDSGASMADYIDAVATFKQAPNADERKAMGYKNKYTWFCDYLNTTDMTPEQKYAVAICMGDYADSTKKRIMQAVGWDGKTPSAQSASSQSTSGSSGKTQILSGDAFWKELERQLGHALTRSPEGQALKAEIDRRKEEERTYDIRTDSGYREYLNLLLGRTDRYEAKDGSVWTVGEDGDVISRTADGSELKVKAVFDKEDVDDQPEDGYTVSTKPGKLAYQMLQNGVMKAWEAPDGWTWKLVDGEIIAEKKGMKMPVRLAG